MAVQTTNAQAACDIDLDQVLNDALELHVQQVFQAANAARMREASGCVLA